MPTSRSWRSTCADGAPAKVVSAAVERWGRLDHLINNAGATAVMPLAETDKQTIVDLLALNVVAPSLLAHEALPHLRRTSGTIINLSSTYGHRPMAGGAHYSATKAAVEQMTRSWALELAGDGVRVNSVAPGPTRTDVMLHAGYTPEAADDMYAYERERIPPAASRTRKRWLTGSFGWPTRQGAMRPVR